MRDSELITGVLAEYELAAESVRSTELEATHHAYRIDADEGSYALRQLNRYMTAEDLACQCLLARGMSEAGVSTPLPVPSRNGRLFVQVRDRLWMLFPWCSGRPGDSSSLEDLSALVAAQGNWVKCSRQFQRSADWEGIVVTARRFRRRKEWAWIVPLDRLPTFVTEVALEKVLEHLPADGLARELRNLLPGIVEAAATLQGILADHGAGELPHMVTHGDFWASNTCVSAEITHVLDLDCFSYEPRITDFAKAANWFHRKRTPAENARLFTTFQAVAQLDAKEVALLPLLMCAHDLYYLVGAAIRFAGETEEEQQRIVRATGLGLEAFGRHIANLDRTLRLFCSGA